MCGIIGYTGERQAAPILLEGLASLEYRGYDSAGIALQGRAAGPQVRKLAGKLANLRAHIGEDLPEGATGIGHTRWATHGEPTDVNAHPHADCAGDVVVAHNGIVENYLELRQRLQAQGHVFASQTDSECIPHLIESELAKGLPFERAVRAACSHMRGANAIVAMSRRAPGAVVGVRLGNAGGIVVGYCEGEMMLASDLPALLRHTRKVAYLEDREMVTIRGSDAAYSTVGGESLSKTPTLAPYDGRSAAKGEFRHFMLKEIHEQPEAAIDALRGRVDFDSLTTTLDEIPYTDSELAQIDRVVFLGMGTSLARRHGGPQLDGVVRPAARRSRQRIRVPLPRPRRWPPHPGGVGVAVGRDGGHAGGDGRGAAQGRAPTDAVQLRGRAIDPRGGRLAAVARRPGDWRSVHQDVRVLAARALPARAAPGPPARRAAPAADARAHTRTGRRARPAGPSCGRRRPLHEPGGGKYYTRSNFLYLGRGANYPLAMEGALKLKELSYIHAEGYPAGEMKHGPISLIDENLPVVALAPSDALYDKMAGNVNEVRTRGGAVIAVATEGNAEIASLADDVVYIPDASPSLTPVLMAVPMQLLAYHVALRRGCDVDQPRNLAKSVTVE